MDTTTENTSNNRCFQKQLSVSVNRREQEEENNRIVLIQQVSNQRYADGDVVAENDAIQEVKRFIGDDKGGCSADEPIDLTFANNLRKLVAADGLGGSVCKNHGISENLIATPHLAATSNGRASISSSSTSNRIAEIIKAEHLMAATYVPKKRGRKRKTSHINTNIKIPLDSIDINTVCGENNDYFQNPDNKQAEVLKAAKSLFSKRTRTLYHWMYPNAPKQQLKAAVAMSWETLGAQEKEFYISQVLGRFGFPQCSLMVNPQLGGITGIPLPNLNMTNPMVHNHEETKRAVSSILLGVPGDNASWSSVTSQNGIYQNLHEHKGSKRKKRLGRPPGSKNKKQLNEENLKITSEETGIDEFQDDPELSRELEQFKWTLHLNVNNNK